MCEFIRLMKRDQRFPFHDVLLLLSVNVFGLGLSYPNLLTILFLCTKFLFGDGDDALIFICHSTVGP